MYKHIAFRQRILSSGKFNTKKEKDSNNGYTFDFVDSGLTEEEIIALKQVPSRADLDRACDIAWKEAAALATQFCGMEIPALPLKNEDLHPRFCPTNDAPATPSKAAQLDSDFSEPESNAESDSESFFPLTRYSVDFELDTNSVRRTRQPAAPVESDTGFLGEKLTVSEALAHAAHHIVTENYIAAEAAKAEAELEAIDKELDANPETPVSGRMLIANLLNPAPPIAISLPAIPTFLPVDGKPIQRRILVEQRTRHCAGTRVHSEKTRKPETNVEYAGGEFSLNHAAHQLKEGLQQSEGLRNDTVFQKARYRRWIASGRAVEWVTGCRLDKALSDLHGEC
jgi:hypothetical protein